MNEPLRFPSKVDWWIPWLIAIPAIAGPVSLYFNPGRKPMTPATIVDGRSESRRADRLPRLDFRDDGLPDFRRRPPREMRTDEDYYAAQFDQADRAEQQHGLGRGAVALADRCGIWRIEGSDHLPGRSAGFHSRDRGASAGCHDRRSGRISLTLRSASP